MSLKSIFNKDFQKEIFNKSKTSNFSNLSDNQNNNSKIKLKENNFSDINSTKNKTQTKKIYSKFKIEQIPNFKKNTTKNSGHFSKINKYKSNISNNIKSSEMQRFYSIKTLEKTIQQKIIDISMQIEKESSLIREKTNKINLSLFIKKKLGVESDIDNSSFTSKKKFMKKENNKSFIENNKKINLSTKIEENELKNYQTCTFSKYKNNKRKKEKFRVIFKKKILYDSFDSEEEEEIEQFFISPNNIFILFIDILIIISTLFNMIYTPFYISTLKCFCYPMNKSYKLYIL